MIELDNTRPSTLFSCILVNSIVIRLYRIGVGIDWTERRRRCGTRRRRQQAIADADAAAITTRWRRRGQS